jgi:hypothetical protein
MVCMFVLVYSSFGKNPSIRSQLTTHLSRWGCYSCNSVERLRLLGVKNSLRHD